MLFRLFCLPLCLALVWLAPTAVADESALLPVESGEARLCRLYLDRSQERWGRFNLALRPLGKDTARWQVELWQDLLFVQQACPLSADQWPRARICELGRHLLGAQRNVLALQSWRRSQTGEEATLLLELGDQVDQFCGAPVMAVQGVLERWQSVEVKALGLQPVSSLAFNAQGWAVSFGENGSSASTKK